MRTLYILSFLFTTQASLAAVIKGTVIDKKTKEPLIGATVKVKELNIGSSVSLSGTFKLAITAKGSYTLACSFVGYHSIEKTIEVSGDENFQVDFELEENSAELAEVVVKGILDKNDR